MSASVCTPAFTLAMIVPARYGVSMPPASNTTDARVVMSRSPAVLGAVMPVPGSEELKACKAVKT